MGGSETAWAWPWWTVIVAINVLNLVVCAIIFKRSITSKDGDDLGYRKRMRVMGLIFTLVAAYRAVFVSRYLSQMAWFDTLANSSLLIRLLAISAELSFAGLFALAMLRVNKDVPAANKHSNSITSFMMTKSPYVLLSCIFLAQFFATSGLITKNVTLFAIEETLWSMGFLSILPLAMVQLRRVFAIQDSEIKPRLVLLKRFAVLNVAWGLIYCSYGLFYHLPLEMWPSAMEQMQTGLPLIKTGMSAISDAFVIVNESKAYGDWGFGFLFWHSAYFTVCVWLSIFLMQAPRIKDV